MLVDRTPNMSDKDWDKVKYFERTEFSSPDAPLSYSMMNRGLIFKLDLAREISGVPFTVSSGYRTENHNKKVGGTKTSKHRTGDGVDLIIQDSEHRYQILKALIEVRFNKIGIYKSHIHVELHPDNKNEMIFHQ